MTDRRIIYQWLAKVRQIVDDSSDSTKYVRETNQKVWEKTSLQNLLLERRQEVTWVASTSIERGVYCSAAVDKSTFAEYRRTFASPWFAQSESCFYRIANGYKIVVSVMYANKHEKVREKGGRRKDWERTWFLIPNVYNIIRNIACVLELIAFRRHPTRKRSTRRTRLVLLHITLPFLILSFTSTWTMKFVALRIIVSGEIWEVRARTVSLTKTRDQLTFYPVGKRQYVRRCRERSHSRLTNAAICRIAIFMSDCEGTASARK